MIGRDAFQETDIIGITQPITKHSVLVEDVTELEDAVHEAFAVAVEGRPRPGADRCAEGRAERPRPPGRVARPDGGAVPSAERSTVAPSHLAGA